MKCGWHRVLSPLFIAFTVVFVATVTAAALESDLVRPLGVALGLLVAVMGLALATNHLGAADHSAQQSALTRSRWPLLAPKQELDVWIPRVGGVVAVVAGLLFAYQAAFDFTFSV